ncbi:MAG: hypothetical protein D6766_06325, partial [Verrucomicrobia bacterium]
GGLMILDLSDPANPVQVGTYAGLDGLAGIALSGTRLYLADQESGILILDVSDPTRPVLMGRHPSLRMTRLLAASGGLVFATQGRGGMQILDVSNAVGSVALSYLYPPSGPGILVRATVSGNLVFAPDGFASVVIYDLSDPVHPVLRGRHEIEGRVRCVAVAGHLAFVATELAGLAVLDVSDPAKPVPLPGLDVSGSKVVTSGNRAYLAGGKQGLVILEYPDLGADAIPPAIIEGPRDRTIAAGQPVWFCVRADGSAPLRYQWQRDGEDIPGATQPCLALSEVALADSGARFRCVISNDHGAVASKEVVLTVFEQRLLGRWSAPSGWVSTALAVTPDTVYLSGGEAGLAVVRVSDPAEPVLLAVHETEGPAKDVAVTNHLAFVAEGEAGLSILDVGDPAHPVRIGRHAVEGDARRVVVTGNLALVGGDFPVDDGRAGTMVLDVSDPTHPVTVGHQPAGSEALAVSGRLAIGDVSTRLSLLFDVTQPSGPGWGLLMPAYSTGKPALAGGLAVMAYPDWYLTSGGRVALFDVSDPANTVWLADWYSGGTPHDLAISGRVAFVTQGTAGLSILDISNPAWPTWIGGFPTEAEALLVGVAGTRVFLLTADQELLILDYADLPGLSEPFAPVLSVGLSDGALVLNWTAAEEDWILEAADRLGGGAPTRWQPVEAAPSALGNRRTVMLPLEAGPKFYRLRRP